MKVVRYHSQEKHPSKTNKTNKTSKIAMMAAKSISILLIVLNLSNLICCLPYHQVFVNYSTYFLVTWFIGICLWFLCFSWQLITHAFWSQDSLIPHGVASCECINPFEGTTKHYRLWIVFCLILPFPPIPKNAPLLPNMNMFPSIDFDVSTFLTIAISGETRNPFVPILVLASAMWRAMANAGMRNPLQAGEGDGFWYRGSLCSQKNWDVCLCGVMLMNNDEYDMNSPQMSLEPRLYRHHRANPWICQSTIE